MSRKYKSRTEDSSRFTPSRVDAALYNALTTATRPLATKELVEITGGAQSTVDHTMRYWTEHGLIKRVFLDKCAWHTWAPSEAATEMAAALADASEVEKAIRPAISQSIKPKACGNPDDAAAQVLRAIARLLESAADRLEQER